MANVFVNPGWNTNDDPITVYILNGYVYKTDPGEGSSTALCYNKLGAKNNDDMNGAVSAASDGDTIYVYNDSADFLSLSTPSGTYCPPGLYELYLNRSTASQKNLAVWANKLQLGENNSYIKLGDNGISMKDRILRMTETITRRYAPRALLTVPEDGGLAELIEAEI